MKKAVIISSIVLVIGLSIFAYKKISNNSDKKDLHTANAIQHAQMLAEKFPHQDPNVLLQACMNMSDIDASQLWNLLTDSRSTVASYSQILTRYGVHV